MNHMRTMIAAGVLLFLAQGGAQSYPGWKTWPIGQTVCVVVQGNYVWAGTFGNGVVRVDRVTGDTVRYTTANSGLPCNDIRSIAVDSSGNKWIGTYYCGLAKFDGTNWTVYDSSNSELPRNEVTSIAIDNSGTKWIGSADEITDFGYFSRFDGTNWTSYPGWRWNPVSGNPVRIFSIAIDDSGNKWLGTGPIGGGGGGLVKFDNVNWTIYTPANSGLPSYSVFSVTIDAAGNKWIGTFAGLAKFDDTNWIVYNTSNTILTDNEILYVAIDSSGNKWIGTFWGGVAKFDDTNWTLFQTSNSGLPHNQVNSIVIDSAGTRWIGTYGGLASFNENTAVSNPDKFRQRKASNISLRVCHFNKALQITYSVPENGPVRLAVYSLVGKEIKMIVNEMKPRGTHRAVWGMLDQCGKRVTGGIYICDFVCGTHRRAVLIDVAG